MKKKINVKTHISYEEMIRIQNVLEKDKIEEEAHFARMESLK